MRDVIRYSEAFKMQVVRELERGGISLTGMAGKYGVRGKETLQKWIRKYGNGTLGKVIRVQKPEEIDELKKLKARVKRLETALADANIELALERAYTELACERAGINDVPGFKKKCDGQQPTGR